MKKIKWGVLCILFTFGMASCATTGTNETAEGTGSAGQEARFEEDDEVKNLVESLGASENDGKRPRETDIASTMPTSDAFRTNYLEFGPDAVQFIVSIPNNTDQEINAIIWLCDDSTVDTNVFDLRTYPDTYKEKYLIAIMPYEFETENIKVRDIKDSVGDVVSFVKVIAEENQITLNRIILVGYTFGRFSMAYL
jgi:MoaA/NifB/PqqE/SkfB family radical SAM enzyme